MSSTNKVMIEMRLLSSYGEIINIQNSKDEYPEPADELMLELTMNELKSAFRYRTQFKLNIKKMDSHSRTF